jgi:hypothetical protein
MSELFIVSDLARRRVEDSLDARRLAASAPKPPRERPRRAAVRSSSAAALRSLANRLEPSPSH